MRTETVNDAGIPLIRTSSRLATQAIFQTAERCDVPSRIASVFLPSVSKLNRNRVGPLRNPEVGEWVSQRVLCETQQSVLIVFHRIRLNEPSRRVPIMNLVMAEQPDNLWGQIRPEAWRDTPCTPGRVAIEDDVREGRAVFYIDGPSQAAEVRLPRCALLHEEGGKVLPVILIQAESRSDGEVLVGYRPLVGGNGICMLGEVDLLDGPDEMFN